MRDYYRQQVATFSDQLAKSDWIGLHKSLAHAHIVGQKNTFAHTYSHFLMLRVGLRKRDFKEIFGQSTRILAALLFSRIWVPKGNTGWSDVSPFKAMPLPEELKHLFG